LYHLGARDYRGVLGLNSAEWRRVRLV